MSIRPANMMTVYAPKKCRIPALVGLPAVLAFPLLLSCREWFKMFKLSGTRGTKVELMSSIGVSVTGSALPIATVFASEGSMSLRNMFINQLVHGHKKDYYFAHPPMYAKVSSSH